MKRVAGNADDDDGSGQEHSDNMSSSSKRKLSSSSSSSTSSKKFVKSILSIVSGADPKHKKRTRKKKEEASTTAPTTTVKKLRKEVLISLQLEEDDKTGRKMFKKAIQSLETNGTLSLDADGNIQFLKSDDNDDDEKKTKKRKQKASLDEKSRDEDDDNENENENETSKPKSKKQKKSKSSKKKKVRADDDEDEAEGGKIDKNGGGEDESAPMEEEDDEEEHEEVHGENDEETDDKTGNEENSLQKNVPCKSNPQGITRIFVGNLPFRVDETSLREFFKNENEKQAVTHIKWITDRESGRFYGSAFIEMSNSRVAAHAMQHCNGKKLMGRPLKLNFAPARDGDVWPPTSQKTGGATAGGQAGGVGIQSLGPQPEGCVKLFIGNLSYDIDDDVLHKFFQNGADAELRAVRWLHHRESGDFKGCGFVEFWNSEACGRAANLNGKTLLGRPIRIDWTD